MFDALHSMLMSYALCHIYSLLDLQCSMLYILCFSQKFTRCSVFGAQCFTLYVVRFMLDSKVHSMHDALMSYTRCLILYVLFLMQRNAEKKCKKEKKKKNNKYRKKRTKRKKQKLKAGRRNAEKKKPKKKKKRKKL